MASRGDGWWKCPEWWDTLRGWATLTGGALRVLHVIGKAGGTLDGNEHDVAAALGKGGQRLDRVNGWIAELIAVGLLVSQDGGFRLASSRSEAVKSRRFELPSECQVAAISPASGGHLAGQSPASRRPDGMREPSKSAELDSRSYRETDKTDKTDHLPAVGGARGFALAPPPVEPAAPKRKKAKKEPPPFPEPVPVPAHMQPLVEYQLRALARTDGPATQTVDQVVRWAIEREKLLGWPVDWKWRIAAFEDWQASPKGRRYTNTTGALGTWMDRARKDGKLESEWRAGAQPQGSPVNGSRKGFGAPGAPTNPDGSFNPNHAYNPVPPKVYVSPTADWTQEDHDDYAKNMNF